MTSPTTEDAGPTRWASLSRAAIVVVLLGIAGLWIYALTRQPQPPPDLLDDTTFAERAERVCAATATERESLPLAFQTDDPMARADVVEEVNTQLATMLTTLRADLPAGDRDRGMLDEWLGDWDVYLDDRREYVERLRSEGDTRIYVSEKDGRQITVAIDRFGEVNDMLSCRTPKDVS